MSNKMFFYQLCSMIGLSIYAIHSFILYVEMGKNINVVYVSTVGFILLLVAFAIGLHSPEKDQL